MVGGSESRPEFDIAVIIDMGECTPIPDRDKPYDCLLRFNGEMAIYAQNKQALLGKFHTNLKKSVREANKSGQ